MGIKRAGGYRDEAPKQIHCNARRSTASIVVYNSSAIECWQRSYNCQPKQPAPGLSLLCLHLSPQSVDHDQFHPFSDTIYVYGMHTSNCSSSVSCNRRESKVPGAIARVREQELVEDARRILRAFCAPTCIGYDISNSTAVRRRAKPGSNQSLGIDI
jgi:hypothetical protein